LFGRDSIQGGEVIHQKKSLMRVSSRTYESKKGKNVGLGLASFLTERVSNFSGVSGEGKKPGKSLEVRDPSRHADRDAHPLTSPLRD